MAFSEYIGGLNYFYSDEKCTSCGIYEEVCLAQKIKMLNQKPLWQKNIFRYMCYACVNFCPAKAIPIKSIPGVKSFTVKSERYTHPYATVRAISQQKKMD